MRTILLTVVALVLAAPVAAAEFLGEFQAWDAAVTEVNGKKVCYMSSPPQKDEGDYTQRGPITMFVTHWPAQDKFNEISVKAGYTYQEDSTVELSIGDDSWTLWTEGDRAWAYDADDEKAIVDAMKAGLDMVVQGTSSRGTVTTDTYSLRGFTAAHRTITQACQ